MVLRTFTAAAFVAALAVARQAQANPSSAPLVDVVVSARSNAFTTSASARFSIVVTNRSDRAVVAAAGRNGIALSVRTAGGSEAQPDVPDASAKPLPKDVALQPGASLRIDGAKLGDWGYRLGPGSYSLAAVVRVRPLSKRAGQTTLGRSNTIGFDVWGWRENAGF